MLGSTCGVVAVEISSPRKLAGRGAFTAKAAAAYGAAGKVSGAAHRANSRSLQSNGPIMQQLSGRTNRAGQKPAPRCKTGRPGARSGARAAAAKNKSRRSSNPIEQWATTNSPKHTLIDMMDPMLFPQPGFFEQELEEGLE